MNKIICITGASSGFGEAIAKKFSANGWDCILIARRLDRLEKLKFELELEFNNKILIINLDLTDKKSIQEKINNLSENWQNINVLVNNAGLAIGLGSFYDNDIDDIEQMVDVNINGVLYMSKAVLPFMVKNRKVSQCQGHIINIGSTAGKVFYKNGIVYSMTKAAINALSEGQRIDLLDKKIKVTLINPGAAETEFSNVRFRGDIKKAKKVYNGYIPLYGEDIANAVFYCATLPDNVCVNEMTITCLSQANTHYYNKES
jgi:NADP-dependent 3-hydroxy acid dehydrogenase YdfG